MLRKTTILIFFFIFEYSMADYINSSHTKPWKVRFYPKKSLFKKSDLMNRGCSVFIKDCPSVYKLHVVCARHYNGHYKSFNNYCEMEYDNCNSWRRYTRLEEHKPHLDYEVNIRWYEAYSNTRAQCGLLERCM